MHLTGLGSDRIGITHKSTVNVINSGIATGGSRGAECQPSDSEKFVKNRRKEGKNRKNRGKKGRIGKN